MVCIIPWSREEGFSPESYRFDNSRYIQWRDQIFFRQVSGPNVLSNFTNNVEDIDLNRIQRIVNKLYFRLDESAQ